MNSRPLRSNLFEMKQQMEESEDELQATEVRSDRNETTNGGVGG